MTNCSSLKDELIQYLAKEISVSELRDMCVLTLPTKTIDDRYPAVYVERRLEDTYFVHDGGKSASELFAQGIHLTDVRESSLLELAFRNNAVYADGMFQATSTAKTLNETVLRIGQCATLAMWHALGHKPVFTDVPVLNRVENGLRRWADRTERDVRSRTVVSGKRSKHAFDFAAFSGSEKKRTLGVKVLRPSDSPIGQAREYGFMVYDLEKTAFEEWLRVAVITKADMWTDQAKDLVRQLSHDVVEVETGREEELENALPRQLRDVA